MTHNRHSCGINYFTSAAKLSLHIPEASQSPLPGKTRHQTGKLQQVQDAKKCASLPHNDVRIRSDGVGPLRWNGANGPIIGTQQQPLAGAVIAFADAGELTAGERMEGMGYADKLRRSGGNACIPT
jgi:hypothetical protein